MRWAIAVFILLHGLIHFMGVVKSLGMAELPQLADPIPTRWGLAWLIAGLALAATAVLYLSASRTWWLVGLAAVGVSQVVILTAWSDAKFGTLANLIVLALALYGFASCGPLSLRAEYDRAVLERLSESVPADVITEEDLVALPEPVQRYMRQAGAIGQSHVTHFGALWRGRIRGGPDEPWMEFTAEQHNFVDPPARFFFMEARRARLPVDVLHIFRQGSAEMRVRLLSFVPLVSARGPELTLAETVTLLNDLAILAPGALTDPRISWTASGDQVARAEYTIGANTIAAVLRFNESGELITFVSEDRLAASSDGTQFTRQRWSTPLSKYRDFGPWRVASQGEGRWHPERGQEFSYIELQLLDLKMNPTHLAGEASQAH